MSKKLSIGVIAGVIASGLLPAASGAALFVANSTNQLFFNNFENIYDASGNYKPIGSAAAIGDHLVGIFNVQNIDAGGTTHWFSGPTEQLTGIFAHRINAVLPIGSDPFDPAQTTSPHLVLGPPTLTMFGRGEERFSTGLGENEGFAFFYQTGIGTTIFSSGGSLARNVANATDGINILTLGYSDEGTPADSPANAADDTGYGYAHSNIMSSLANFGGEANFGLDLIQNATEFGFRSINDPNENELGSVIGVNGNHFYGTSEFEINPNSQRLGGVSQWDIASNDPFTASPFGTSPQEIPEPASLVLLGLGLAAFRLSRTRQVKSAGAAESRYT